MCSLSTYYTRYIVLTYWSIKTEKWNLFWKSKNLKTKWRDWLTLTYMFRWEFDTKSKKVCPFLLRSARGRQGAQFLVLAQSGSGHNCLLCVSKKKFSIAAEILNWVCLVALKLENSALLIYNKQCLKKLCDLNKFPWTSKRVLNWCCLTRPVS